MIALGQPVEIDASYRHTVFLLASIALLGAFTIYAVALVTFVRRGLHGRAAVMGCSMVAMGGVWTIAYSAQSRQGWGLWAGLGIELTALLGFAMVARIVWRRRARRRVTFGQS